MRYSVRSTELKCGSSLHFLLQEENQEFGVNWEGPVPYDECDDNINVPETPTPLTTADVADLRTTISSREPSMQYGVDLYEYALANLDICCRDIFEHFMISKRQCMFS